MFGGAKIPDVHESGHAGLVMRAGDVRLRLVKIVSCVDNPIEIKQRWMYPSKRALAEFLTFGYY